MMGESHASEVRVDSLMAGDHGLDVPLHWLVLATCALSLEPAVRKKPGTRRRACRLVQAQGRFRADHWPANAEDRQRGGSLSKGDAKVASTKIVAQRSHHLARQRLRLDHRPELPSSRSSMP